MQPQDNPPHLPDRKMIESVSENETKITEIHKHPIGIIWFYLQTGIGLSIALGLMFLLLPQFITEDNRSTLNTAMALITILSVGVTLLVLFIAGIIYRQNYLIISDKNITQVLQNTLFNRQVSELSMANIEDVSSFQKGVFATIFNYGKMVIETAGEQNNFIFTYCPRPNYNCKILLDARQKFIETDPSVAMRANNRLNMTAMPANQPYAPQQMPQPTTTDPEQPTQPPIQTPPNA